MQTFLPYPDFVESLRCLDYRRLGKQRVEAMQLLGCLDGKTAGWVNHPAAKMWKGCENALRLYHNLSIDEWCRRGYVNRMLHMSITGDIVYPTWLGNQEFHASHRSNLLRKDPEFYGKYGWEEPADLPYVWPVP